MTGRSMLYEALSLAELGWRLFPVGLDGRTPLIKRGCHAASSEAHQIQIWWQRWPRANVAIACGPASGLLVLDVDTKGVVDGEAHLAALEAEFGPLPGTVTSRTPSGGRHLLFAHPMDVTPANRVGLKRYAADGARTVYAGLDVRGAGGSICAPPSRRENGAYRWERSPFVCSPAVAPNWLLSLMLSEPPLRPVPPPVRISRPDKLARYVCAAVNGECRELARMAPGSGRNQRLFIAAARLGSLVAGGLLQDDVASVALEQAAADCGLVAEDGRQSVLATIASGFRRGACAPREVAA